MIAPRGCHVTSLQTKEVEYGFSGFIPTNKQTKQAPWAAWGGTVIVSAIQHRLIDVAFITSQKMV